MERKEYHEVIEEIVTPIIGSFIVVINSIVIYYIIRYRNTQHNPIAVVYILNMAIGDFFVGFIMILLRAVDVIIRQYDSTDNHNSYHDIRNSLISMSLFISVLNLIPLTIDRVWAVRYPISHRQSRKTLAVKICIGVWSVSIVFVTVFYCVVHFSLTETKRFNKMIFPLATYPTTLIFIICYSIIFRALKSSRKYRERTGSRSMSRSQIIPAPQLSLQSKPSSVAKYDEKKYEVKFLYLAIKTVVVFIVCWFPIATCSLPTLCQCNKNVELTFMTLGYLNAALTPLVHYSHLRQALKKKLRRFATLRKQHRSASTCTLDNNSSNSSDSNDSTRPRNASLFSVDTNDTIYTVTKNPQ